MAVLFVLNIFISLMVADVSSIIIVFSVCTKLWQMKVAELRLLFMWLREGDDVYFSLISYSLISLHFISFLFCFVNDIICILACIFIKIARVVTVLGGNFAMSYFFLNCNTDIENKQCTINFKVAWHEKQKTEVILH